MDMLRWLSQFSPFKEKRKRNNDKYDDVEQQRPGKRFSLENVVQSSANCAHENGEVDVALAGVQSERQSPGCDAGRDDTFDRRLFKPTWGESVDAVCFAPLPSAPIPLPTFQSRGIDVSDIGIMPNRFQHTRQSGSSPYRVPVLRSNVATTTFTCPALAEQQLSFASTQFSYCGIANAPSMGMDVRADPCSYVQHVKGQVSALLDDIEWARRMRSLRDGTPSYSLMVLEHMKIVGSRQSAAATCSLSCAGTHSPPTPLDRNVGSAVGVAPADNAGAAASSTQRGISVEGRSEQRSVACDREGGMLEEYRQLLRQHHVDVATAAPPADRDALELEIAAESARLAALSLQRIHVSASTTLERLWKEQEERAQEVDQVVEEEPPFRALTQEELAIVTKALNPGRNEMLTEHKGGGIEISREKMACLRKGEWLNDDVINMYIELLKDRQKEWLEAAATRVIGNKLRGRSVERCHFFNTFFYNKLYQDKRAYEYRGVQRWTRPPRVSYQLKDCTKVIVPVHQRVHWCLAVINLRDQAFEYYDSMGGRDVACLENLARYIVDEVKDKSGVVLDVSGWERRFMSDIPQQNNGYDCGVFMIKFADFVARDREPLFSCKDMDYFRQRLVLELLNCKVF